MKIGVLIDRLQIGGVEKIAIEETLALRRAGHEAYLVILRKGTNDEEVFPDLLADVPLVYLDQRMPRALRFSFGFPIFHFFSFFHITYPLLVPFFMKQNEFDYFIVHGTYTAFSATTMRKRRGIKFSAFIWDPITYILGRVYMHGVMAFLLLPLRLVARALDIYVIKAMDTVLVGGDAHNAFIQSVSPKKPIEVIYPSVYPAEHMVKKDSYVLAVTAWKRGKNPEYLVDVLKHTPKMHIKLAGGWVDNEYRAEYERYIQQQGLQNRIEIIGSVSEKQLTALYARALVVLQTNDDRGFGMPALEAAAQGTTFIITEGQGVCALFVDTEDGFYTREKDTRKITDCLRLLLDDAELAAKMGENAWRKARKNYSWDTHAKKLISIARKHL